MAHSRRIEFTGSTGDQLAARLDLPGGVPLAYAIFAHCFSCSKDILAAGRIARRLAASGIAVLRFDFTGLGHSEGDFANTNFSSNIADLLAAARFLEAEYEAPSLLVGHSLGGAAVIAAALDLPSVQVVATLGAPADAAHVTHQFAADLETIESKGVAEVRLAGRPFTIKKQFLEDIAGHALEAAAARLKRPLLIAHSPIDETVGIDNASRLFMAARHPKSFLSLDGADHLLSRKEDARHAGDMIAAWAGRYVDHARLRDAPSAKEGVVVVEETGRGRYENFVVAGDHVLLADEPVSVGGLDHGPSPYGYLSAALGTCSAMTVRMYADRKGWPLERVRVTISHSKDFVDGHEDQIDLFDRVLRFDGPLDDAQRARLLEIADKCPVHRTLNNPVEIRSALETPASA